MVVVVFTALVMVSGSVATGDVQTKRTIPGDRVDCNSIRRSIGVTRVADHDGCVGGDAVCTRFPRASRGGTVGILNANDGLRTCTFYREAV